jgi:hypothetical protein
MVVRREHFNLRPVDTACSIDLIGGELRRLRNRKAGNSLCLRNDANLDTLLD